MSFELFIGTRYFRAKQKQGFVSLITFLSIAGVAVGVMALIVVIAVMTGFESDLRARVMSVNSDLTIKRHGGNFTDYRMVEKQAVKAEGVLAASSFVNSQVMIRSLSGFSGALLTGINPATAGNVTRQLLPDALKKLVKPSLLDISGDNTPDNNTPGIILGKDLAGNLGVVEGSMIYIISPRGLISPMGHMPSMKRFIVVSLFTTGMYQFDSALAYIHIEQAQKILRMGDTVTGVEVRVRDIFDARKIGQDVINQLGHPYWAKDWMQINKNLFSALKLEKTAMSVILTMIVLVAAFNIVSALIMTVMEKKRDIAILKAMGTTRMSIGKIFVFKGMVIGTLGISGGVLAGCILCLVIPHLKFLELPADIYYITELPITLIPGDVLAISIGALLICFLSTLYPAMRASAINPVEALRYG